MANSPQTLPFDSGVVNNQAQAAKRMSAPTNQYSADVAETPDQVEQWRPTWTQWQWHPNGDIDFYLLINELWKERVRPIAIQIQHNGKPAAILAGRVETAEDDFRFGYLKLFDVKVQRLNLVTGGWMGDTESECSRQLLAEVRRILKSEYLDYALLCNIPTNSTLYAAAKRSSGLLTRDYFPDKSVHWKMRLPESYPEFLQKRKKKHRYWLNRLQRVLEEEFPGRVQTRCFRQVGEVEAFCADAETVASLTYQRSLNAGFINDAAHQRRCRFAAQNDRLRGYILYVDGHPRSFWCGTLYKQVFHLAWTGYHPDWKKYELGTVLFLKMVENLCGEEVQEIDFGLGEASYKERFGDENWEEATVHIYSPTLRGATLNLLRLTLECFSRTAKAVLRSLGIITRLKRFWRDRLGKKEASQEAGN
jgi:hypothetical protein